MESKNDKDLHKILEERKKTEQLIQKRYEQFYVKEQIRLNREEDLMEKRKKIAARNNVDASNFHCSQGSVLGASKAVEEH